MVRLRFTFAVVVGALVAWSWAPGPSVGTVQAEQQQAPPDFEYEAALSDGEIALRERRFEDALEAFTTANERRDRKSPEALYGICRVHNALEDPAEAEKACESGLKYAGNEARLVAGLRYERGVARVARATGPEDKRLRDALEDLQATVSITDEIPMAWFNLGVVAATLGRDDVGSAAFQAYLDSGEGSQNELARELLFSPRRLREPVAPEFSIETLDHGTVSLKSLRGRTVLLDFWATWCGPCQIAEPALVKLHKKYADQPFTIVGIDFDPPIQEPRVRNYIEQHEMAWPQHIDASRAVLDAYDVDGFPTYIVIDADGIVSLRVVGWRPNTEQQLDREIAKSLEAGAAKSVRR